MVLLKGFSFLLLNVGLGFMLVVTMRAILFYPSKRITIKGLHVPLTPAMVYRLKNKIVDKLHRLLHDFVRECEDMSVESRITKLEDDLFNRILERMSFLDKYRYLPGFIKKKLQKLVAQLTFEIVRYFIRTFIPYVIERYQISNYIRILEEKADISFLVEYYNRYIHRFLLYFSLSFFFLCGVFNMIIYFIIR